MILGIAYFRIELGKFHNVYVKCSNIDKKYLTPTAVSGLVWTSRLPDKQ
jgi:hypothetical protein